LARDNSAELANRSFLELAQLAPYLLKSSLQQDPHRQFHY
jgi:hypothetical protein